MTCLGLAQQTSAMPEQVQIEVPAARAASAVNRIEQMINHFGGDILSSSAVNGRTEILVRIPEANAQHFHDNVGGNWKESNSIPASGDRVFQITVTFK